MIKDCYYFFILLTCPFHSFFGFDFFTGDGKSEEPRLGFSRFQSHLYVKGRSLFHQYISQPQLGSSLGEVALIYLHDDRCSLFLWLLVFIMVGLGAFRFPPTSVFIVTPSPERLPTKA